MAADSDKRILAQFSIHDSIPSNLFKKKFKAALGSGLHSVIAVDARSYDRFCVLTSQYLLIYTYIGTPQEI